MAEKRPKLISQYNCPVEYSLTAYGRTLRPITEFMCAWGKKHLRRLEEQKGS
jgi:DNA-binding HxlR family transcriptional regulator